MLQIFVELTEQQRTDLPVRTDKGAVVHGPRGVPKNSDVIDGGFHGGTGSTVNASSAEESNLTLRFPAMPPTRDDQSEPSAILSTCTSTNGETPEPLYKHPPVSHSIHASPTSELLPAQSSISPTNGDKPGPSSISPTDGDKPGPGSIPPASEYQPASGSKDHPSSIDVPPHVSQSTTSSDNNVTSLMHIHVPANTESPSSKSPNTDDDLAVLHSKADVEFDASCDDKTALLSSEGDVGKCAHVLGGQGRGGGGERGEGRRRRVEGGGERGGGRRRREGGGRRGMEGGRRRGVEGGGVEVEDIV